MHIGLIHGLFATCLLATTAIAPLHAQTVQAGKKTSDLVQGMSKERMSRIAGVMKQEVDKRTFPGAVTLIARNGEVIHLEAHGYLDAAKTQPLVIDAIFRLASMTKPLVSVIAMMLMEQGLLKLNDPIETWLPELKGLKVEVTTKGADGRETTEDVPVARPPTVQDLMRHTSGFFYLSAVPSKRLRSAYEQANIEGDQGDISTDEMMKRLGQIPLAHQPGTSFRYSISTDVLGFLIERVTRKTLDAVLQDLLLGPLEMRDTGFWVPADKQSRLAELFPQDPFVKDAVSRCRVEAETRKTYLSGGSGLCGTIGDYIKFLQMVANGGTYQGKRYLSKKTTDFMLQNHLVGIGGSPAGAAGPGYGFGLGFAVRLQDGFGWSPGSVGDAMWGGVFGTSFTIDPKERLIAIMMTTGGKARIESRHLFKNLVYGAMME